MIRKKPTPSTQAKVLLSSRRRCCICFGLTRDTSIKQGQLAHLDHNHSNSSEENLAFLCLEHHDKYDSKTSQSKNFTTEEVLELRKELYMAMRLFAIHPVSFGTVTIPMFDPTGDYIRLEQYESAEINIRRMENGQFHISGIALWGSKIGRSPHIGEIDFISDLHEDTFLHTCSNGNENYILSIRCTECGLVVQEQNYDGMYGINVTFSGEYGYAT